MINIKDEGYIKFLIDHETKIIDIPEEAFNNLNNWRTRLFDLNLIGETSDGIGFGNISIKYENSFLITGSATGKKRKLEKDEYACVLSCDYKNNKVVSKGMTKASSESMSHAVIYECNEEIKAVIHVHNTMMWNKYIDALPTTSKNTTFGTPEMAYEIQKLLKIHQFYKKGILVMGGHQDGVITFGNNLDKAGEILLNYYNKI